MRQRLQRFLPIVLIALMVQVLAPIGAAWAAAMAAGDPMGGAQICHSDPRAPSQSDQSGNHRAHHGACLVCCAAQTGASLDAPGAQQVTTPYGAVGRVLWSDEAVRIAPDRVGSNTQARAPPPSM